MANIHVYKFRILSEEDDKFIRDIEIKSTQTFEDFHFIILESLGFKGNELASFYTCDRKWNKHKEITLLDMTEQQAPESDQFEDGEAIRQDIMPMFVMKDSKINKFIEDPHQRFIYEYDFLNLRTFYIELVKIIQGEENIKYPRCTLSKGKINEFPDMVKSIPADSDLGVNDDFEDISNEFNEENFSEFDNEYDISQ